MNCVCSLPHCPCGHVPKYAFKHSVLCPLALLPLPHSAFFTWYHHLSPKPSFTFLCFTGSE